LSTFTQTPKWWHQFAMLMVASVRDARDADDLFAWDNEDA
jgi:hypothetical protein